MTNTNNHQVPLRNSGYPRRALAALLILAALLMLTIQTSGAIPTSPDLTHSASAQLGAAPLSAEPTTVAPELTGVISRVTRGIVDITANLGSGHLSMGTGIVLSSDGLVLTNYHVIAHSEQLSVDDLADGNTYRATVIGADTTHDIALIRMRHASRLHTAELGDSDTVHTGDIVASIGNAYGLGRPTVGIGPVTHLHRRIASTTDADSDAPALTGLIQARSNIQPGESGGPMVNQRGEVIGVNVAYVRTPGTGEPTGTGYAIPINRALSAAHHLLANSLDDQA
jgi:S1-C subfamily serine protease